MIMAMADGNINMAILVIQLGLSKHTVTYCHTVAEKLRTVILSQHTDYGSVRAEQFLNKYFENEHTEN